MAKSKPYQENTGTKYPGTNSKDTDYLAHARAAFGFSRLPEETLLEPLSRPASLVTFERYSGEKIDERELAIVDAEHRERMAKRRRRIANS